MDTLNSASCQKRDNWILLSLPNRVFLSSCVLCDGMVVVVHVSLGKMSREKEIEKIKTERCTVDRQAIDL